MDLYKNIIQQFYYIISIFIFFLFLFMHYNITTIYGSSSNNPILKRNETELSDIVEETINPNCDQTSLEKKSVFSDLYKYVCKKELENTNFFEYVLFIFFSSGIICYEVNSKILSVLGKIVYNAIKVTDKQSNSSSNSSDEKPKPPQNTKPKSSLFSSIPNPFTSTKPVTTKSSPNLTTSLLAPKSTKEAKITTVNAGNKEIINPLLGNTNNQAPKKPKVEYVGGGSTYQKLTDEGDKKKEKTKLDIFLYTLLPIWGLYFVFDLITTLVKERFVELNKIFGNRFNTPRNKKLSVSTELSNSFLSLIISIISGLIVINCIVYILYLIRGMITSNNSKLSYFAILSALPFVLASVGINLTVVEGAGKKGDGKKGGGGKKPMGLGKAIQKSNKARGKDIKQSNKRAAEKRKKERQKEKAKKSKSSSTSSTGTSGAEAKPVTCTSYNYLWYFLAYFIVPIFVSIYTIIKFFIIGISGVTQIKDIGVGFLYLMAVTIPILIAVFISALIEYAIAKQGIKLDDLKKSSAQFI